MRRLGSVALLAATILGIVLSSGHVSTAAEALRQPVPPLAAQEGAAKTIRETFKEDYSKKDAAGQRVLAAKLLLHGEEQQTNNAIQFVLLREARDLAVAAGDCQAMFAAVNALAENFELNGAEMKLAFLAKIDAGAKTNEARAAVASAGLELIDQMISTEQYQLAARLAPLAAAAAGKAQLEPLKISILERGREARDLELKAPLRKTAEAKLQDSPDDAEANLVLGQHQAYVYGRWYEALPMLAKSSDMVLNQLAKKEIAKPTSAEEQLQLADGWWDVSEKQIGRSKELIQRHAAAWYRQALEKLRGFDKSRVEKRLQLVKLPDVIPGVKSDEVVGARQPAIPVSPAIPESPPLDLLSKPVGPISVIDAHDHAIYVKFSRDTRKLLFGDKATYVYDLEAGKELFKIETSALGASFTPDSQMVYAGLALYDARTGKPLRRFATAPTEQITTTVLSLDGRRVISGSADGKIHVWDAESQRELFSSQEPAAITRVALSADGSLAAMCNTAGHVRVWDVTLRKILWQSDVGGGKNNRALGFSNDDKCLYANGDSFIVRIWDGKTGKEQCAVPHQPGPGRPNAWNVRLSPDGRLAVGSTNWAYFPCIYDTATGKRISEQYNHHGTTLAYEFAPDSRFCLTGSNDKKVRFRAADNPKISKDFEGHTDEVRCVAISADGRIGASGSKDKTVRLWRLPDPSK